MSIPADTEKYPGDIERYRAFIARGRPGPHAYVVLLGLKTFETERLWNRVGEGLPIHACERFQKNFLLDTNTLARLLHTPGRTLARRRQQGRLRPEESDRLLTITRVFARALDLFEGDRDSALQWLARPQPPLAGRTPLETMATELGLGEVERLVDRLEQGVFV